MTRDESPADVRRALRRRRRLAGSRHRRACAARRSRGPAVRPLAVQRASAVLRLHHVEPGADRRARRFSRGGGQPERRRLALSPVGDRDRGADGALDRGADRLSRRLRRAAGQRRQHGELRLLPRRARGQGRRDVRSNGPAIARPAPLRVYASTETHTWIRRPRTCPASAPTRFDGSRPTSQQRMDIAALDDRSTRTRSAGTCRSWSSARPDRSAPAPSIRCRTIAAVCRRHDVWFHVDGAYGALAARCRARRRACARLARGRLGRGRSAQVAVRAARGRLRAGARPADLLRAFSYHPPYYHFDHEVTNYFDYGPQNSRGFRALKVWLALRQVGRAGYLQMIADDMRLARHLHALVQRHPEFEAMTQHLSITTFRYVPRDLTATRTTPNGEDVPAATESGAADARRAERRGVSVERGGRRPVRAPRLHRELPHVARRRRSAAVNARAPRPRDRRGAAAHGLTSGAAASLATSGYCFASDRT